MPLPGALSRCKKIFQKIFPKPLTFSADLPIYIVKAAGRQLSTRAQAGAGGAAANRHALQFHIYDAGETDVPEEF